MGRKHRGRLPVSHGSIDLEATYVCETCGEEIVVPVDVSGGAHQDYVEDCPVCCNPMVLHVDIDGDGEAHVDSEHE
jgi:transcription elongation factor Elf1